jgi:hypothetical protein
MIVVTDKKQTSNRDAETRAADALEQARQMKPGRDRNEALKEAGRLRSAITAAGYLASKELKPPK